MNVTILVNKIGESVEDLIKKKLKSKKLPECLGNMSPPLINTTVYMEDSLVFKVKGSIPKENVVLQGVDDIVEHQKYDTGVTYNRFVLDVNGRDMIETIKEKAASSYVDHVSLCLTCKYVDICDKLTAHYLSTINLVEANRRC